MLDQRRILFTATLKEGRPSEYAKWSSAQVAAATGSILRCGST
jgi:hypothetical protein